MSLSDFACIAYRVLGWVDALYDPANADSLPPDMTHDDLGRVAQFFERFGIDEDVAAESEERNK